MIIAQQPYFTFLIIEQQQHNNQSLPSLSSMLVIFIHNSLTADTVICNFYYQRFIIKEYTTMKQQARKHPPHHIYYHSLLFNIAEPEIGHVTQQYTQIRISFEDHATGYSYHTIKPLQHISYKTVATALNQSQPQIIKALLFPYGDTYRLAIRVKLQYLNEIEQVFEFEKQQMSEQRRRRLQASRQAKKELSQLRNLLIQFQKEYIISGAFHNKQRAKHQIKLDIHQETTLLNLTLHFRKMHSQIIKVGYYYYDALTDSKVSQNMLPDQLYSHGITEICLVAEKSKFDQVIITVEGEFQQASYTIKVEGVIESKPLNIAQMLFRIAAIGFCIWVFYTYDYYLGSGSSSSQV